MIWTVQMKVSIAFTAPSLLAALLMGLNICCRNFGFSTRSTIIEVAKLNVTVHFSALHKFPTTLTFPVLLTGEYVGNEIIQWNPGFPAVSAFGICTYSVMFCKIQDIVVATSVTDANLTIGVMLFIFSFRNSCLPTFAAYFERTGAFVFFQIRDNQYAKAFPAGPRLASGAMCSNIQDLQFTMVAFFERAAFVMRI